MCYLLKWETIQRSPHLTHSLIIIKSKTYSGFNDRKMVVSLIHMRFMYVNLFVVYDLLVCGLHTVFESSECVSRACNLCNDRVPAGHLVWHVNVAYLTYSTHFIVFFVLFFFFLLFCNEFFFTGSCLHSLEMIYTKLHVIILFQSNSFCRRMDDCRTYILSLSHSLSNQLI